MTTSMEPPPASLRLFPSLGPLERLAPARLELPALRGFHRVCKATVDLPLRRDLLLEGPEADRGAVAGRPSLYTRDETRATQAARGGLAQGARAGQAMGRAGVRLGEAPWKSSSGGTTSK